MRLFKFKGISNPNHALDIIVRERLFCQRYPELNDPFEGQFSEIFGGGLMQPLMQPLMKPLMTGIFPRRETRFKELADTDIASVRVCSLSAHADDVRMWSLYAESHRGIAIEVDFSGFESQVHQVIYQEALPSFERGVSVSNAEQVLTRKTSHWAYETEYRVISSDEFLDISSRVKRVILGVRASKDTEELLKRIAPPGVAIARAELDLKGARVKVGKDIRRV